MTAEQPEALAAANAVYHVCLEKWGPDNGVTKDAKLVYAEIARLTAERDACSNAYNAMVPSLIKQRDRARALLRQALEVAERQVLIVGPIASGTKNLITDIRAELREQM